jgi:two-component system, NtrC family, response regulator GlrR
VRSSIIIVDPEEGQPVGVQVKSILQENCTHRIDLLSRLSSGRNDASQEAPRLVIPIFPTDKEKAARLLLELRVSVTQVPMLPVVSPEGLSEGFQGQLPWTQDFLVTPLREAEVRARVHIATAPESTDRAAGGVPRLEGLSQLIGEDPAFVALKCKIPQVAKFESTVLLTGETGTGKEKFARALHYLSQRAGKPFLPVNCGAIPLELFESELYGHRVGAFTSAVVAHPGLIAEAEGGTLFLDEIETLTLAAQIKLLRFLQDHTYYAVGSAKPKQANVWIVASTNVELARKIEEGAFREDLYYRLAVISLALPPLRHRKGDIPLLAEHFWKRYAARAGLSEQALSPRIVEALCQHRWAGNVRELENVIQRIAVLTESQDMKPEDLPIPRARALQGLESNSFTQRKAIAIEEFERSYLTELLRVHGGNVTHAAREAKKDRRVFGRLIKKYQIMKH